MVAASCDYSIIHTLLQLMLGKFDMQSMLDDIAITTTSPGLRQIHKHCIHALGGAINHEQQCMLLSMSHDR